MAVARELKGGASVRELYEGPLSLLQEMEGLLQVEGDPDVVAMRKRRAETQAKHKAVLNGR